MGELESIGVFLAVAEQGSFVGAARQLGLTPASVTRTVAGLEKRLGVQLLVRTTRQVALTAAGAVYAARVASLARGIAQAGTELREEEGVTTGRIRISAPISLGLKLLPEILARFAAAYPGTTVSLNLSDRLVNIVEEDFDLAIRISGQPTDKSTIWRKICPVPRVLVAAPAYLAERGKPVSPDDLMRHECLSFQADSREETWELSNGASRRSHKATGRFSVNNGDVLSQLALSGQGIALLPRFIVQDDLDAGGLSEVLADWSTPEIWLTLYYPPYERLPVRVATFSNFFETFVHAVRPLNAV